MRLSVFAALASSALLLTACSSFRDFTDATPNQGPCPAAGSVYETQRVVFFNGEGEQYTNIEFTGEITNVQLFCRYVDDDPIEAQLDLEFAFGRGEAARSSAQTYEFFVAVTRTNRAVIEKQVFPIEVKFKPGQSIVTREESIDRVKIPRADSTISGANFEVLVGFNLTDEQRAFNEAGRRYLLQTR